MQGYTLSPGNTLSDRYTLDMDGKHFRVNVRNSAGARFSDGGKGHAIEFSISNGRYRAMANGTFIGNEGKYPREVGDIDEFYKEMSGSLRQFGSQILGIGIPESITGMPTRRQVRRDLKEIYTNARAKALEKTEE